MKKRRGSRTPMLQNLSQILNLAMLANEPDAPPVDELVEISENNLYTRRDFIKISMASTCGITACTRKNKKNPKIAIVGGGLAGLVAARQLQKRGVKYSLYEGSSRLGGRIHTAKNVLASNLASDLGGEFIDSNQIQILSLVQEFELQLIDKNAPSEVGFIKDAYYFNGRHYTKADAVSAFRETVERMKVDIKNIQNSQLGMALDKMSIAEYLDRIELSGWLRKLVKTAYVAEYGMELEQQSALNLLYFISTDLSQGKFKVFGDSDKRYRIAGGTYQLIDKLAASLTTEIHYEHKLVAVKSSGRGFILSFANANDKVIEIKVDFVIIAIPFSVLREVKLTIDLPPLKKKAIEELGYGTNSKVMAGFQNRIWRKQKYAGGIFSDTDFQTAWDHSLQLPIPEGAITFYCGGKLGQDVGNGNVEDWAKKFIKGMDKAFPGVLEVHNGKAFRCHWPGEPFSKGSYSCYLPGQYTSIAGVEGEPVGQMLFAGEHCSYEYQAFMNGAVESGYYAADLLLQTLGKKV